jgi:tetratricopeptide (TPR) repeat protein
MAGRRGEALEMAEQALAISRRLAEENPAAHLPNLAKALSNLGNRLAWAGRWQEAVEPTEQSVAIRRRLAEENPAAQLPGLARGLREFAWVRVDGKLELHQALAAIEEAVRIYLKLAEPLPQAFAADLRGALHTQAKILDALGRTQEAGEIHRLLAHRACDTPR